MPNKSIYIKNEDQHLFDQIGPNLSEGLAEILRERDGWKRAAETLQETLWVWINETEQDKLILLKERGYSWTREAFEAYVESLFAGLDFEKARNEECDVSEASAPSLEALKLVVRVEKAAQEVIEGTTYNVRVDIVNCTYREKTSPEQEIRVRITHPGERNYRYHDVFFAV